MLSHNGRPRLTGEPLGILSVPPALYTAIAKEMGSAWANFIFGPMEGRRDELLSLREE